MRQRSLASAEHALKKERTRRETFLDEMERIVPWSRLGEAIAPSCPRSGRVGHPPIGVPKMPRMHCLQPWSVVGARRDDAAEVRRLLLANDLTKALFDEINAHLAEQGLLMRSGTIIDATTITPPSSTKKAKGGRDPDMHQTKKGNQWHFGVKSHIGVAAESGLVQTVVASAANVRRPTCGPRLGTRSMW